jgi:hypothetical protein
MSVKSCIQIFSNSLNSIQTALDKGQKLTPEYLAQFQKSQIEFYRQIPNLTASDVQALESICSELKDVIEKTRQIEIRFTMEKTNGASHESMVKILGSIADDFRSGEENRALVTFKRSVPDGDGSVAGDIYGCMWKVLGRPDYGDIGRLSFNNWANDRNSTPSQKALAVEMAMVSVITKALEKGQIQRAYAEFHELPYRMKEAILLLLSQRQSSISDVEAGRKWFFDLNGHNIEPKAKIGCLIAYQDALEKAYSHFSDGDQLRMLTQEFQEKERIFASALKQSHDAKWGLYELLQTTHTAAIEKLQKMQGEQNTQLLKQIASLQSQNYDQNLKVTKFEERIRQLELENQQMKAKLNESNFFEEKKVEQVDPEKPIGIEEFVQFAQKQSPQYTIEDLTKFITQGKNLVAKIQNGEAASIPTEARINEIVPLFWYMFYFAVSKKQGFKQGTIVFRDPGHAIAKFFLECGKKLSVYDRSSSHFTDRRIPTFFDGKEITRTFGIDTPGLPGDKQTVHFAPIQTKDGLDWTFIKPEDWGLGDCYQFMGHTWDFCRTRIAHLRGQPAGPEDRKEHILPEIKKEFQEIYALAVPDKKIPEDVKKFGIAGMKAVFQGMLNDDDLSSEIQTKMSKFLEMLHSKYDYLNTRNGDEAMLGMSFISGADPQPRLHQSLRLDSDQLEEEHLRDAQMRVKYAVTKEELADGISSLRQKAPLTRKQFTAVDASFDKQSIILGMAKQMQHFTIQLTVDGQPRTETAESLFELLSKTQSDEQALRLMAMMQEKSSWAILMQLDQWFAQPNYGVVLKQLPAVKIDVQTGSYPKMKLTLDVKLVTTDATKPVYDKEIFSNIEGQLEVDFNGQTETITARFK